MAGALCAVSSDIFQLIVFRVAQAIGAGAATAIATAIIKDVYRGRKRETTLALVQSMVVISPAVAPVLGALLLNVTSWRGIFVAQAVLGVGVVAGSVAFEETLRVKNAGNAFSSLWRLGIVLKNRTFAQLLLIFSLLSISGMAFISTSSYIYEDTFGVGSQVYSYFFALYAVGLALGPLIYLRLSQSWRRTSIISACFAVSIACGIMVLLVGPLGPWPFIAVILPAGVTMSVLRPPASYLMLDQHEADAGSVSALMNSSSMMMGSIGMAVASLQLGDRVQIVGALYVIVGTLCGSLWLLLALPRLSVPKRA